MVERFLISGILTDDGLMVPQRFGVLGPIAKYDSPDWISRLVQTPLPYLRSVVAYLQGWGFLSSTFQ
jgi:hypothetical protein